MSNHKTFIFYLQPVSGYRTELRSDTLWGLICWGIRLLYGEAELLRFLESYESEPDLLISSAFPYKTIGRDTLRFFPVPVLPAVYPEEQGSFLENYRLRKDVKKIRWVNESDFNKILSGELSESDLWARAKTERQLNAKKQDKGSEPQELIAQKAPLLNSKTFTHNTIHRINLSTFKDKNKPGQLFHSEEIFIVDEFNASSNKSNTGLFFLAKGSEAIIEKVAAALRFYRFNGLGGDRSTGKGTFNVRYEPYNGLTEPADANVYTNLSLYNPAPDELKAFEGLSVADQEHFNYLLEQRKGRIGFWVTDIKKRPMLYFKEASVFPTALPKSVWGQTPRQVHTPSQHPYYSYGHAFMVKMKIK